MRQTSLAERAKASHKLLIIDELGYVPLSQTGAELLFEVFSQRYVNAGGSLQRFAGEKVQQ